MLSKEKIINMFWPRNIPIDTQESARKMMEDIKKQETPESQKASEIFRKELEENEGWQEITRLQKISEHLISRKIIFPNNKEKGEKND